VCYSTLYWWRCRNSVTYVEHNITPEDSEIPPMVWIEDIEVGLHPFIGGSSRTILTANRGIGISDVSPRTWNILLQKGTTCLTGWRINSYQLRGWTVNFHTSDRCAMYLALKKAQSKDNVPPWPRSASMRYVYGDKRYIHFHQRSWRYGWSTPLLEV